MIKVLIIVDTLSVGGAEQQAVELATRLNRREFEVSVCSLSERHLFFKKQLDENGIRNFAVDQSGKFDFKCLRRLYKLIRQERPHIVNTFLFTADVYGRLAARLAGVPAVISSQRNMDFWKKFHHILADRLLAGNTDLFVANAMAVKGFVRQKFRVPDSKICVVYNGIDSEKFKPGPEKPEILSRIGIPEGARIIGMIAHFAPRKDHEMFLRVAARLKTRYPDLYFVLLGDDGALKTQAKNTAKALGISLSVRFLPSAAHEGGFENTDILPLLDVSVLFSHYEGCANVILESMACAKPVVASRVGGNSEIIREGKTGFLVDPVNPKEAIERIAYILDNPGFASSIGDSARAFVKRVFSFEKMASSMEEIYRELLKAKKIKPL